MLRPTPQERIALRNRYAAPGKPVTKVYKIYSCGQVVYENENPAFCVIFAQRHGIKAKPTLK